MKFGCFRFRFVDLWVDWKGFPGIGKQGFPKRWEDKFRSLVFILGLLERSVMISFKLHFETKNIYKFMHTKVELIYTKPV